MQILRQLRLQQRSRVTWLSALCICLLAAVVVSGCFGGGGDEEPAEEVAVRAPRPTFTPTSPAPEQPTAVPPAAPAADQPAAPGAEKPRAVLNDDLINLRRGPGVEFDPLGIGMRGDEFEIVGKTPAGDWWQVCCFQEQNVWISTQFADTSGPIDSVQPVAVGGPAPAPAEPPTAAPALPAPQPTVQSPAQPAAPVEQPAAPPPPTEPAEPTATPAPAFPFNLVSQEQFPENNDLVRIFLYVSQGDQAVPGFSLRVTKDGAEVPVAATTSDSAGFTWPVANPRQRFQNMKVEFPGMKPGGTWVVELIDGSGAAVGPAATFTLTPADTNRELYVRYEKPS